jgi:hypothetical protein
MNNIYVIVYILKKYNDRLDWCSIDNSVLPGIYIIGNCLFRIDNIKKSIELFPRKYLIAMMTKLIGLRENVFHVV